MMRIDGPDDSLASFGGVDVESVEVFTDVVERFVMRFGGGTDLGLDAEVQEPGV